jgi:hypothetical protein
MRRLVRLLALGGLVVLVLRRRAAAAHVAEGVTIGYADGTTTVLEAGSPKGERLLAAAGALM